MLPGLQQPGDFTCTTSISCMCQPARLCSDFCRRNLSDASTQTSAPLTHGPQLPGQPHRTLTAIQLLPGAIAWWHFFLHLPGLPADMKSGLCGRIYAEVDAERYSTCTYIYIHTCPRLSISSSTVTHHVSSNTFASYKNNHNARWHKSNTEENDSLLYMHKPPGASSTSHLEAWLFLH